MCIQTIVTSIDQSFLCLIMNLNVGETGISKLKIDPDISNKVINIIRKSTIQVKWITTITWKTPKTKDEILHILDRQSYR